MQKLNLTHNLVIEKSARKIYTGYNFVKGKRRNQYNFTNKHVNPELEIVNIHLRSNFYINKIKFYESFTFDNIIFYDCHYLPNYPTKSIFDIINTINYDFPIPWMIDGVPYYDIYQVTRDSILFNDIKHKQFGLYYQFNRNENFCPPNINLIDYRLTLKNQFFYNPPLCYNKKKNDEVGK